MEEAILCLKQAMDGRAVLRVADYGGKAVGLAKLAMVGCPIPETWLVHTRCFNDSVRNTVPGANPVEALRKARAGESLIGMAKVANEILAAPLSRDLLKGLNELWHDHGRVLPWGLAVRSSATCEDVQATSMAGLAESVLGVTSAEALVDAVRRVWASALSPRALQHLAHNGIRNVGMGVVIQEVVRADASGVMVTQASTTFPGKDGSRQRMVNATFGLGPGLVDGAVSPDIFRFGVDGTLTDKAIADKPHKLELGPSGLRTVPVAPEQRCRPTLNEDVIGQLAEAARKLEEGDGIPHDVEFAVQGDRVVFLQARPLVGAGFPEGGDLRTVWSRANVGEALPGVATPLTWSIARSFADRGFRQAFGSLGCTIPPGTTLAANVHGRFYLNMTAFMQIASQVPGLDASTLVSLGGGQDVWGEMPPSAGPMRRAFLRRLPLTVAKLVAEQLTLRQRVASFEVRAEHRRARLHATPLESLSDEVLGRWFTDALSHLDETGRLMLTCASASLASNVGLTKALGWLKQEGPERLARLLAAGANDLESAQPGLFIQRIAHEIRRQPELAMRFSRDVLPRLEELPADVRKRIASFMERFGDRAIREPELSTPRWREDPSQVLDMIAVAVRMPEDPPQNHSGQTPARVAQASQDLRRSVGGAVAGPLLGLASHSRQMNRLRERMRAWVTRDLSDLRALALEAGRRLHQRDPLFDPSWVFHCTVEELTRFFGTAATDGRKKPEGVIRRLVRRSGAKLGIASSREAAVETAELGHMAQLRLAAFVRDRQRPEPPVTFTGRPPPAVVPPHGGEILEGLPASDGVVEGRVRVLDPGTSVSTLQPGEILVAHTTDVGLTPLFLVAAGVVTELGGPLSHAALVAREYGVPAVVNVAGATRVLRTGDWVQVDGSAGQVRRGER